MEGGRARKSHSKLTHSRDLGDAWKGIAKPVKISVFFKALPPQQNSSPAVLDSPSQPSSTECPLPRSCMACAYLTGPVRPFLPSPRNRAFLEPPSLLSPGVVTALCAQLPDCGLLQGRSCALVLLASPSPSLHERN